MVNAKADWDYLYKYKWTGFRKQSSQSQILEPLGSHLDI